MEDTTVFPPLRVDPKITISHSIQVDRNGKDGQATGFREEVITGEQMGSSGAVREEPKSIMKEKSSSPADLQNYVPPKFGYSGLVQVDPADEEIGDRNVGSFTDAAYKVKSKPALAVLTAFDEPRSEHYALTQLDTGGKTDQGASEYMTDRSLGFVDTKAIAARIGGNGNGKLPLSVAPETATNEPISVPAAINETTPEPYVLLGPVGGEQSPLSVAPGTFTNKSTCSPAVIEATKFDQYGSAQMCPAGGVQSDTMVGLIGNLKSGLVISGIAPDWKMGSRAMGESVGRLVGTEINQPKRDIPMGVLMGAQNGRHMGDRGVHMGDKVGEREGEFFYFNGCLIPAKRNAHDTIGDSAMGDRAGMLMGAQNGRHMGGRGVHMGDKVGERVGEFFDLNGCPIPAKRNAHVAIGDSAMGDCGSKGDRGSREDRALGDSAGSRAENEVVPLSIMTQKRPQERIQVISAWKSLFSAKTVTKSPLEFVAPEIVNGKPVIEPPAEAVI